MTDDDLSRLSTTGRAPAPGPATLRLATLEDAEAICRIYNHEVENTTATFDLVPRNLIDQRRWISDRSGAFAAIVAVVPGDDTTGGANVTDSELAEGASGQVVAGFASLSAYKERAAYRTTVEDSVYVRRDMAGRGIGRLLLQELVGVAAASGFHSIIARIEASGAASRALHARCGFELVGVEREVGRKFNRWLDVAVMQLLLTDPVSRPPAG